jgi:uncharacterized protein
MILLGTIINGITIILGSIIGTIWTKISERTKTTVMHVVGLIVTLLGIQMGMKSEQFLIVIASLVFGAMLGENWALEDRLNSLGNWLEKKVGMKHQGSMSQAFITSSLVFVVGAMAIIGALDSGLRHDHTVLYTKAVIDGFCALMFTATLGIGVAFSAIPVMLYQGSITLLASQINTFIPAALMDMLVIELTAVGGIMIFAIGLNLLKITTIRAANLLPSLLLTIIFTTAVYYITST